MYNLKGKRKGYLFMSFLFLIFFEDDGEIRKSSVKRINYINVKETRLDRFRAKFDNGP